MVSSCPTGVISFMIWFIRVFSCQFLLLLLTLPFLKLKLIIIKLFGSAFLVFFFSLIHFLICISLFSLFQKLTLFSSFVYLPQCFFMARWVFWPSTSPVWDFQQSDFYLAAVSMLSLNTLKLELKFTRVTALM